MMASDLLDSYRKKNSNDGQSSVDIPRGSGMMASELLESYIAKNNPKPNTREVSPAPEDGFDLGDALAAGFGQLIEHVGTGIDEAMRPEDMTPDEWKQHQSSLYRNVVGGLKDTGSEIKERNLHQYEDNSLPYHLQNALVSLPESAAILAASYWAGNRFGGPVGGFFNAGKNLLEMAPRGRALVDAAYRAYRADNAGAKIARAVLPQSARTFTAMETGAGMEAYIEQIEAEKRFIEKAKANGTYVPGETERQAKEVGNSVFWDNMAIISAFNSPEYNLLFGKGGKGLLGKALRLAGNGGLEGAEEIAQELASEHELGEPTDWRALRDSGVAGGLLGIGMHGATHGIGYAYDRATGAPTEEEIERAQQILKDARKQWSNIIGGVTQNEDGTTTYDPNSYYGDYRRKFSDDREDAARQSFRDYSNEREQSNAMRDWADKHSGGVMSDAVYNSIVRQAQEMGIPVNRALAVAIKESNGSQDETSPVGAIGVMQLMPETAESLGVDPYDTEQNIRGGLTYLKQQYEKFGDWDLAFAAYNAGPGAVEKYGGIPDYSETQNYVARINEFLSDSPESGGQVRRRTGNVFGTENYDMPVAEMESTIEGLKPGWAEIIPQIGGVLKNKFGYDPVITSAARTHEHQMRVNPDAPNSYHIIQGDGGDAIDISLADGELSPEQEQELLDYFKGTGLFNEVLYHAVVGGKHLHLGGLNTEALANRQNADIGDIDSRFAQRNADLDSGQQSWADYVKERRQREESSQQERDEESKPLFDMSAEDEQTQELLGRFARERLARAVEENDTDTVQTLFDLFDEPTDTFINTKENRDILRERFGNDITTWAQDTDLQAQPTAQITPTAQSNQTAQNNQPKPKKKASQSNPFLSNSNVKVAVDKLREKAVQEKNTELLTRLQAAKNNIDELKTILKENGVEVSEQSTQQNQGQQDTVKENTTPEDKTVKGKTTPTKQERLIKTARAQVSGKVSKRKVQGKAIVDIAVENGVEIPTADVALLLKGGRDAVGTWRDNLMRRGLLDLPTAESTQTQSTEQEAQPASQQEEPTTLVGRAQKILDNAIGEARQNWKGIKRQYRERAALARMPKQQDIDRAVASRQSAKGISQRIEAQREMDALRDPHTANLAERERTDNIPAWRGRTREDNIALRKQANEKIRQRREAAENNEQSATVDTKPRRTLTGAQGNTVEVTTDSNKAHQVRYRVVEANELNSSHVMQDGRVVPNENYPSELQPRDRRRATMQDQTTKMANNLNPADLLDARNVNQGAPVVRSDGVVLNGNGRTMAIRTAYENGRGHAYKKALVQNAERLGLNADEISKMNHPVLVRETTQDLTQGELRDLTTSQTGGARLGAGEQAKADAEKLSTRTLDKFPDDDNVDLTHASARDFLTSAISDITTADERNALSDSDGNIAQAGILRVKRALFAAAYGDEGLISRMTESTDDNVRNVTNALFNAAPLIAKVRAMMKKGTLHDYDLSDISKAVSKLSALRDQGVPVEKYLNELPLWSEHADSDAMREILSFLDQNKRSAKKISAFLKGIAKGVIQQGNPRQGNLFGEIKPESLKDIVQRTRRDVENNGEQNLFDTQEATQNERTTQTETAQNSRVNEENNNQNPEPRQTQTPPKVTESQKSSEGDVDTTVKNIVADKDLSTWQKLLKNFGKALGVKTVFFDTPDGRFHGKFEDGTVYINVNSNMPTGKVFWHEVSHWLEASNPELFKAVIKAAGITDAQRKEFLDRTKRKDLHTNEEIDREIIADQFEDVAKRTGLLQSIADKNGSLVQRVVLWVKNALDKFIEHFRNKEGRLTRDQANRLANEFGRVARQLKDADGKPIFRVSNRTGSIEVIGGRESTSSATRTTSPAAQFSVGEGTPVDFSEDLGDNEAYFKAEIMSRLQSDFVAKRITDDTDIADLREWMLAEENNVIANESYFYERKIDQKNADKTVLQKTREKLKVALSYAEDFRRTFASPETLRGIRSYLQSQNKGRKEGGLAESFRRALDGGRPGDPNGRGQGRAVIQIPGAYRIAYGRPIVKELLEEIRNEREHPKKGSALFSRPTRYSVSAEESTVESLKRAIKAKVSSIFSLPKPRRDMRIKTAVEKITQCRLLFSNVKDSDETIIDDINKVITSPHADDWQKILPRIGGKLAKSLNLEPSEAMNNYIANWILTGAPNVESAEKEAFKKALSENPATAELFDKLRHEFQEYNDLAPEERIKESIVHETDKGWLQKLLGMRENWQEEFTDDLHPVYRMVQQMKEKASPEVAKMLDKMINVYKNARLLKGRDKIAEMMVYGTKNDIEQTRKLLGEQNIFTNFDKFKTIRMILEDVGAEGKGIDAKTKRQNLLDFEAYCIAKLDKEIYEKNRALKDDGTPKYPHVEPSHSEADADATIAKFEKRFGQAQKDLVAFSNTVLSMYYNAGMISDATFFSVVNKWKNYVPMARIYDENEEFELYDSFARKTGDKRDRWSPIAKIISNAHKLIGQAERNKVKLDLVNTVRCGGYGELIAETDNSVRNLDNVVHFHENGEVKRLNCADVSIARALNSINSKSDKTWIDMALRASSSILRGLYTTYSLDFTAGNFVRDSADSFIHNKELNAKPWIAAMDIAKAAAEEIIGRIKLRGKGKTKNALEWEAMGGAQSGFFSEGIDQAQREIDELTKGSRRERLLSKSFFSELMKTFQDVAAASEDVVRIANYVAAKKNLASQRSDGKATLEDRQNAALASRDASVDFAKAGRSMRQINKVALFSNAAVQGLTLWGRTLDKINTKEGRRELAGKVFRTVMSSAMLFALQAAWNYSDDDRKKDYRNAPNWEKNTYWIFGGLKIPKGLDISIKLGSAMAEEMWDKSGTPNPIEWERISKALMDSTVSITSTVITPLIEAKLNSSFFYEAPIVPYHEQKLEPRAQYGKRTTSLAKMIGETFNASPRMIDHLINGYGGFIGRFASKTPDYFMQRSVPMDEFPMIRRFVFNPDRNPKVVQDYYKALDKQESLFNTYKLDRKNGKNVKLPEEYDRALHARLKAIQEPLRNISHREKKIIDDPKLSYEQKQEKLRELEKRRKTLCEKVFR